ncbi:MAG: hypothetical protein RIT81_05760 [Deltaproteobacteria bacterium]
MRLGPMLGLVPLFLVAALAVVFARAWLHQIGDRSWAMAATVAAAMMSTVPTALARLTGDLVVATLIFGALAIAGTVALWNRPPSAHVLPSAPRTPAWVWGLVALGLFLVTWAALGGHWWDEHNCHDGVVTVLARGIVPPVHPLFPTEPFRYHYGFDVLAAQLRAFTGASADDVIDGATIVCFVLLMGMARELGATVGGRLGSALAMFVVPFGGGMLSLFFWGQSGPLEFRWSAIPQAWLHLEIPPPVISNFFQHPQGLGMPLSLAVLRIFVVDDDHPLRLVTGGLLLGALGLAHIVFFGVLGLVLGVLVVYRFVRQRNLKRAGVTVAALLGALGVAYLLGGMLERGPSVGNVLRFGRSFFSGPPLQIVMLHVVHFGAPMIAAFVGIVVVARRPTPLRVALVTAAVLGFAIPNFVTYERSWDIVKFYGIGAFFANLLVVGFVADLWRHRHRAFAVGLVFVTVFTGYLWIVRMGILDGQLGIPKMNFPAPSAIGEITAEQLEPYASNEDFVFTPHTDLGLSGGMRTPGFDWRRDGIGYMLDREVADRLHQHHERAKRTLAAEDLAALSAKFVVLAPSDLRRLTPAARASLEDPERFEHLFDAKHAGQVRHVYRVLSE